MTTMSRKKSSKTPSSPTTTFILLGFVAIFCLLLLWLIANIEDGTTTTTTSGTTPTAGGKSQQMIYKLKHGKLASSVQHQRQQLRSALHSFTHKEVPIMRLQKLRETHEIVGERLEEVRAGTETVEEIVHGAQHRLHQDDEQAHVPPMSLEEITSYLTEWIHTLHDVLLQNKHATHEEIWKAYHDLTVKTLYPWDRQYLQRMPPRQTDGSVFLSVATYRDENCLNTVKGAFEKAKYPEKLTIGIVQQNCVENCKSGVLEGGKIEDVPPDEDCHQVFCESELGKPHCEDGRVRALHINEPESLGPYAARYFASKLWYGESWFMQVDAHMTFVQDWDAISIEMLKKAPADKPVLSHYPPSHQQDLEAKADKPASRLCGPIFATSDLEAQVVRLEGASNYDNKQAPVPRFAPFTAAGYFVAHSDFLREVPFDPFLPWIFMGEEIIMSTRLWTAGYTIFSPTRSVVGHIYVRRHKPKFWESVHRAFTFGVFNPLQAMILGRVKHQLGYPECSTDMMKPKSLLTAVEQYGMGTERPLEDYLAAVGLNTTTKVVTYTGWCENGTPPPGFEEYAHLYEGY